VFDLQGTAGSGRGGEHTDAVAALRPFLQEHAEHFWHELRCVWIIMVFIFRVAFQGWKERKGALKHVK
jgi:hypothetical protein